MIGDLDCSHGRFRLLQLFIVVLLVFACAFPSKKIAPEPDIADPFQQFEIEMDKLRISHMSQGVPGSRYRYNRFLFMLLTKVAENAACNEFDDQLVSKETKELMYSPAIAIHGKKMPYGMGWSVQEHEGLKLIWHYGYGPNLYSSLILKIPERGSTLILPNSDGASRNFNLGKGDVLNSPFAQLFIRQYISIGNTIR